MKAPYLNRDELSTIDYMRLRALARNKPAALADALALAKTQFADRLERMPRIAYAEGLPVSERADEIAALIRAHQVIVITGETGSGKTTQLPKICLAAGRGRHGLIGHTQPRRIAARSVADRIAKELGERVGESVGFKVRFTDHTAPNAFIKLMTDGILLAETQTDKYLNAYDTIIVDEAHERSLNIDFLLGYLKQLLPRRPDLKVIITSATIDARRFAEHFSVTPLSVSDHVDSKKNSDQSADICAAGTEDSRATVPLVEVSGRMYPVEVRYRPVIDPHSDDEEEIEDAIADAVDTCRTHGQGDILVFLPGEREIRETMEIVQKHLAVSRKREAVELLPLFARLSNDEQQRIFAPTGNARRIIFATNVAETSVTVPGIRFVVDSGLARINRYAPRSKVQLLHIEPISQASANQRAGRCGRVGPGLCIRLYGEEDFAARAAFTEPEILRSSLAAVILRLAALGFGRIETFPFMERPSGRAIADGYTELQELGALNAIGELTDVGRQLARLPIEPRLGRILLEARARHCLAEALVIVSALSVPDPRERPLEARQAADRARAQFDDERSDFIALINVWKFFLALADDQRAHRKQVQACREVFLNWLRLREWRDIHRQLSNTLQDLNWNVQESLAKEVPYESLHRALLTGFTTNVGTKEAEGDGYLGPRGLKLAIFPGSGVNRKGLRWIVAAELAETTRLFARTVARIEPEWIELAAGDRVSKHVFDPKWDATRKEVVAFERVSLHGLTLIARRAISGMNLDPKLARDIFIREGLVVGGYRPNAPFIAENLAMLKHFEEIEHRTRRQDVVVDEEAQVDFYRAKIPLGIASAATFEKWLSTQTDPKLLFFKEADITRQGALLPSQVQYPKSMTFASVNVPLTYRFEPGHPMDGVTATVPLEFLNLVDDRVASWLVSGMVREKVAALIKLLPKAERGRLQPITDAVTTFLELIEPGAERLQDALLMHLRDFYDMRFPRNPWENLKLSEHLMLNIRVTNDRNEEIAMGRDVSALQAHLGAAARVAFTGEQSGLEQSGLTRWTIGTLPERVDLKRGKQSVQGFPALHDDGTSVSVIVFDRQAKALQSHRQGLLRLMALELAPLLRAWEKGGSQFTAIALQFRAAIPPDRLVVDFTQKLIDRAFLGEDALPFDAVAYKEQLQRAKTRLQAVGEGLTRMLAVIGSELVALNQTMISIPASARPLADAVKGWRDDLIFPGFLSETPWVVLQDLPRYLKAIGRRIGKYAQYPDREMKHAPALRQYKDRWHEVVRKGDLGDLEGLTNLRWAIEELHVSLFAQELKTPYPISMKRLDKMWEALRR